MCKEADSTDENPDGVNKAQIRNTTVSEPVSGLRDFRALECAPP